MVSVCIPSRGHILGLWATIAACEHGLEGIEHEYCILVNGREVEEQHLLWKNGEVKVNLQHVQEPVPYPKGRKLVAGMARYDTLVFLDDHVIPSPDYFRLALQDLETFGPCIRGSYSTFPGGPRYYHQKITNPEMTEARYATEYASRLPYKAASASHANMIYTRKAWEESGGYWEGFAGYGRDELHFDLSLWSKGFSIWLDPRMLVYHFSPRERDYPRIFTFGAWGPYLPQMDALFTRLGVVR